MRFRLLIIVAAVILLLISGIATSLGSSSLAQADNETIRIEVSHNGFNQTSGEFQIEVEAGQEVAITFVYGDEDLLDNNPHRIFIPDFKIATDILDRDNPEITVRFTPNSSGEVGFMCFLACNGHDNLQKGRIVIHAGTEPTAEEKRDSLLKPDGEEESPAVANGKEALQLIAPEQAIAGQPLSLTVSLRDSQDRPIANAPVKLLTKVDFFTSGLIEIGEVVTNEEGVSVLEYIPQRTGEIEIMARHKDIETVTTVSLAEGAKNFYQAEAGLSNEVSWPEVFVGPSSALEPGEGGAAPTTGLRIPGGLPSLLLLAYVFTVILVWSLYLRVMYQIFRIPSVTATGDINVRLVPIIGMTLMLILVTLLVLILITGPYSHPHILR
jgi:hypothetical protein